MKLVFFCFALVLLAGIASAHFRSNGPMDIPATPLGPYSEPEPLDLDPLCFCTYNWLGPHGYYNYWTLNDVTFATYHDADHWDPDPNIEIIPCDVCFVTIAGANTVFIDEDTMANDMTIGGRHWDDTTVVLGHQDGSFVQLTLDYDDVPAIYSVDGERMTNGQTKITIVGKGFGFEADGLTITVADNAQDRACNEKYPASAECDYVKGCSQPGLPSVIEAPGVAYNCENIRIFHHDSHISCTITTPDVFPQELAVTVQTSLRNPPLSASASILNTYIK